MTESIHHDFVHGDVQRLAGSVLENDPQDFAATGRSSRTACPYMSGLAIAVVLPTRAHVVPSVEASTATVFRLPWVTW